MASFSNDSNASDNHVINLIDQFFGRKTQSVSRKFEIRNPSVILNKVATNEECETKGKENDDAISEINKSRSKTSLTQKKNSNQENIICNKPSTNTNFNGSKFKLSNQRDDISAINNTWESTPNLIITDVKSLNEDLEPAENENLSDEITFIGSVTENMKTNCSSECHKTVESKVCSNITTEGQNIDVAISTVKSEQSSEKKNSVTETSVERKYSSRLRARLNNNAKKSEDLPVHHSKSSEGMNGFSGGTLLAVAPSFNQTPPSMTKGRVNDPFCWVCHKENVNMECVVCPRAFHSKCVQKFPIINRYKKANPSDWVCTECQKIMAAEDLDFCSQYSSKLSLEQLCLLLQFAIHRLKHSGAEPFLKPVSNSFFPSYRDYIIHPMDLFTLECNVKKKMYGSTHSFLVDIRWILHNCIIFNGYHHKLTGQAKNLVKLCKIELTEMETCPSCYLNSCTKMDNWFAKPCAESHTIIWAKMKGFPFWPAKAMKVVENNVDARFFGAHDRAWVPINQCFIYSKEIPAPAKIKKKGFDEALEEVEFYIEQVKQQFGGFKYASWKIPLTVNDIHVPKRFTLDVSWLEKQHINAPHLFNSMFSRKPTFRQINDSDSNSNSEELVNGMLLNSSGYGTPSVPSCLGSSPSISPTSDISCTAQAITVSTTESDCVTFGGSTTSPLSSVITSKNVPIGVFELSPNMNATMPRKLDVKVPKLDPARLTKSRSLDQEQKLKQAMEKIRDNIATNNQINEQCVVEPETTIPTSNTNCSNEFNTKDPIVSSPSCEVTSTTVLTSDSASFSDTSSIENSVISFESPLPTTIDVKIDEPKPDCYIKNLGKTIENCKAMLGIEVCDDVALVESESDSDDQIHADEGNKNDSSISGLQCANTMDRQKNVFDQSNNSSMIDISILNQKASLGKHKPCSLASASHSGSHTKRLKLSKICSEVGTFPQGNNSKNSCGSNNNNDSHLQVQCDDTPGMISRSNMDKYTNKVMDFMKGTMEEMCKELGGVSSGYQNAAINALRMEIDMLNLRHQQEIAEISHNARLVLMEMRNSLEIDKTKTVALLKETADKNLKEAVAKTKRRQWCANCGSEAMFYCCWNTSYCDYRCQHKHWAKHMSQCTQLSSSNKLHPPDQPQTSNSNNDKEFSKSLDSTNISCERDNSLYPGCSSQLNAAQQTNLNSHHLVSTPASQILSLSSYQVSHQQNSTPTSLPAIYSNILNVGDLPNRSINKTTPRMFVPTSFPRIL